MLSSQPTYLAPDERDEEVFGTVVPEDHYLRNVKKLIDFDRFRPILAEAYSELGRPAIEPLLMLRLEFLEYHYNHSDRQVVERAQTDMAYRFFLDLSLCSPLPHHTSLTYFRQRLGTQRHQQIFDALVAQAREHGLVKDRLRLKDATHVMAKAAIPTTIGLVRQTREHLLQALEPWAAADVHAQRQRAEQIRQRTKDLPDEERLLERVMHLRELVAWAEEVSKRGDFCAALPVQQEQLQKALILAHKVLDDRDDPDSKHHLRSIHEPDARYGKHGHFYVGYLLDAAMDADSLIITAMSVLPAGDNEGADAEPLIRQEEKAHGNDVQAMSMDKAGCQGAVLHTLTDPAGVNVKVFVPMRKSPCPHPIQPEDFTLSADKQTLTCPGGQSTTRCRYHPKGEGWHFRFSRAACATCPLRQNCVPNLPQTTGRTVFKSDYEKDIQAARATTQTPEYAQVRKEHPAIERKFAELMRRHDGRHARYRRQPRVLLQQLLTGFAVNIKRIVKLLVDPGGVAGGTVRAVEVETG